MDLWSWLVAGTDDHTRSALPEVAIEVGDIIEVPADVVALKFAQSFYGADLRIAELLEGAGTPVSSLRPLEGEHRTVESRGAVEATYVIFVGVPPLRQLR